MEDNQNKENLAEETFTIVDDKGIFEFTFKKSALKNFDLLSAPTWDNMHQYKFQDYLHNMNGPAIRHLKVPFEQYYINGRLLSDEEAEKMKHDIKFHKKFDEVIES